MTERLLQGAKLLDAYRVFPRIFLSVFFVCYVWLAGECWTWYTALDLKDIGTGNLALVTAFPVSLLSALGGMFTSMYKHYQGGGFDWSEGKKDAT